MFWKDLFKPKVLARRIALLLALQILNCSVDAPGRTSDQVVEDRNFNNMESVVEIVLEKFLGFENAIAEHEQPDGQPGGLGWKPAIDLSFVPGTCVTTYWDPIAERLDGVPMSDDPNGRHRPPPSAPPPKA